MTHDLKFNGVSPCEVLQTLQAHRLFLQAHRLKGIASKYLTASKVSLDVHVKEVRWFWKNPRVIEDATIIPQLLEFKLSFRSFLVLLPHLKPWVTKHITEVAADETVMIRRLLRVDGGCVIFHCGSRKAGPPFPVRFYSLDEIETHGPMPHPQGTILREMVKSAPENWWFVGCGVLRSTQWFLVNYLERRIYSSEEILCTWDDVWDPDSWKVDGYGTLADYWCRPRPEDNMDHNRR
jgi:hypothetical protein